MKISEIWSCSELDSQSFSREKGVRKLRGVQIILTKSDTFDEPKKRINSMQSNVFEWMRRGVAFRDVTCYEYLSRMMPDRKMDLQSRHVRAHYMFLAEKWASVRQTKWHRIHNNEFLFLSLRFILLHTCFHTRHTFLLHLSTSVGSIYDTEIMNNHLCYR